MSADPYFARGVETKTSAQHKAALERCITRLREQIPIIGLRNPKIGDAKNQWIYCTQAWSPLGPGDRRQAAFANGRMIADTMQNLALLHWAYRETGITDYREVAEIHAQTTANYLVRSDATSFHTFVFDPGTGEPRRGEPHQGYADDSCWARGQAWLLHGFAQCHAATGNPLTSRPPAASRRRPRS